MISFQLQQVFDEHAINFVNTQPISTIYLRCWRKKRKSIRSVSCEAWKIDFRGCRYNFFPFGLFWTRDYLSVFKTSHPVFGVFLDYSKNWVRGFENDQMSKLRVQTVFSLFFILKIGKKRKKKEKILVETCRTVYLLTKLGGPPKKHDFARFFTIFHTKFNKFELFLGSKMGFSPSFRSFTPKTGWKYTTIFHDGALLVTYT